MVYLVTQDFVEKHKCSFLEGSPRDILRTIIDRFADDHIVVIDDYQMQTSIFRYLNIDYRSIMNESPLSNHPYVSYEEDAKYLMSESEFLKINKNVKNTSDLGSLLEADVELSDDQASE